MIDNSLILYCRVGWMSGYRGIDNDKIINGGSYNNDNIGHEIYNFLGCNGRYYGFVENKSIHIERLGAERSDEEIGHVTVVWVAHGKLPGQRIVGWYSDSTVYRHRHNLPQEAIDIRPLKYMVEYSITSDKVTLLDEESRTFLIDGMGQNNVFYGNPDLNARVTKYIEEYDNDIFDRIESIEQGTELLEGFVKETVTKARVNQDKFRDRLLQKFGRCCLCGVDNPDLLIASHIKPWTKSDRYEKIDINNGLLLCPNHDKLFDKGYISFNSEGTIIISERLSPNSRMFLNVRENSSIEISADINTYMEYHRENVFE